MVELIARARALLDEVTPLKADCGKICAAACCQEGEGDSGMLLFPGEEALYPGDMDWARIRPGPWRFQGEPAPLFLCGGECPRAQRPLACRIFPLAAEFKGDGGIALTLDVRAWPVCPLMPSGLSGLNPAFINAAREAFGLIASDPLGHAYLQALQALRESYRSF